MLHGSSVVGAQQNHTVGWLLDNMGAKIKTRQTFPQCECGADRRKTSILLRGVLEVLRINVIENEEMAGAQCLRFPGRRVSEVLSTSRQRMSATFAMDVLERICIQVVDQLEFGVTTNTARDRSKRSAIRVLVGHRSALHSARFISKESS